MRKLSILLLVCLTIMLAGCVNTDLTLDIDKKGNMNMSMKVLANDYIASKVTKEDLKNVKEKFVVDDVEKISENGQLGYLLTKKLGNINDSLFKKDNDIKRNKLIDVKEDKGLIFNTYDITLKLKDNIINQVSKKDLQVLNFIGDSVNVNFHVKSPFKLLDSNATSEKKESDGRTVYDWDYTLGTLDNINIKFRVPNLKNIEILIGLAVLILICCFIFIKRRKNKKNPV
ncbi:hypothetical protein [Terrisporobacter sp.]